MKMYFESVAITVVKTFKDLYLEIYENPIWFFVSILITVSLFLYFCKKSIVKLIESSELISVGLGFGFRALIYSVMFIVFMIIDVIELPNTTFNTFIYTIISVLAYCIFANLITNTFGKEYNNYETTRSLIVSMELFAMAILTFSENNFLFSFCILCIFGKWFWIDEKISVSISKIKPCIRRFKENKETEIYFNLLSIIISICIVYRLVLSRFSYVICELILFISIVLTMLIIYFFKNQFGVKEKA